MGRHDLDGGGRSQPPATVVINNYNYAGYVGRAIHSALAQTYPSLEVVVVDDGSSDGSRDVIDEFADRVVVVAKPNGGQASALNAGVRASTGEVLLFLDSDDELYPHAVERVVAALAAGAVKAHFRLDAVDSRGRPLGFTNPPAHRPLATRSTVDRLLATGRYVTPVMSGNGFARAALEAVLPIPEDRFRSGADGYLVTTVPLYGDVVAIEESLGCYRIHGANMWAADRIDADFVRRRIDHDRLRHEALRAHAAVRGLEPRADLELRDRSHVSARLASLKLDRGCHPVRSDTVVRLLSCGVRDAWTEQGTSLPRRLRLCLWFLLLAAAPKDLAVHLVTAMYAPQLRGAGHQRRTSQAG